MSRLEAGAEIGAVASEARLRLSAALHALTTGTEEK
jgi:hypothetical protein